ncbi:MAG: class I SAM-dependent methyltransferase [Arenicellales bacterium]|nr:class I SAM-dependent methyltransferase [Arenicellales bacterium]
MNACCPHAQSASRVFSFFAKRYRKRFGKRGFEPSQEQLLQGLESVGYRDGQLLEIGCGVGHLHQTLLERGARSAVGVDLAHQMLTEARDWAAQRGLADRTEYIEGDFIELLDEIAPADVTLMDKVVCCYPDADTLVHRSLEKTKQAYALTYPRDRWFVRFGMGVCTFFFWLMRSSFRPYVHNPKQIETWVREKGFDKKFQDTTAVWLTQVYVKPLGGVA